MGAYKGLKLEDVIFNFKVKDNRLLGAYKGLKLDYSYDAYQADELVYWVPIRD